MNRQDRARQFMPFASLRGYYDLVRETERIKQPRKYLSEEESKILSDKLQQIKKGMIVKIQYYNTDAYETIEGMVAEFDEVFKTITVIKSKIRFSEILNVRICG